MAVSGSASLRKQDFRVPGKVGIGTTDPSDELTISGSIQIGDDAAAGGEYTIETGLNDGIKWDLTNRTINILVDNGVLQTWDEPTGFVGIGTTEPAKLFHVWGDISASNFYGNGDNITGNLQTSASIWKTDESSMVWLDDTTYNVGIGITSPKDKLHLYNGITDTGIRVQTGATVGESASLFLMGAQDNQAGESVYGDIRFWNADNEGATQGVYAKINAKTLGEAHGDAKLEFFTANAGSLSHAMTINKKQHVGIGITNPTYSLHVYSGSADNTILAAFRSAITTNAVYIRNSGSSMLDLVFNNPGYHTDVGNIHGIRVINNNSVVGSSAGIHFISTSANCGIYGKRVGSNEQAMVFYTEDNSRQTRMTIEHDGGIVMGPNLTDSSGSLLRVHGAFSASTYSRRVNIPVVYQGSAYDGITPPIVVPDGFTFDEIRVTTVSGSCMIRAEKNDTTELNESIISASNAGWTTGTPGGTITFIEDDYIRVHISESKQCMGLSVNLKMTF